MAVETKQPSAKRARTDWKLFLTENLRPEGKVFGLQDLFDNGFDGSNNNVTSVNSRTSSGPQQPNKFYTLRLEHREGGPLAKFHGEERLLLFRSDCRAAIAKIIYSSELPEYVCESTKPSHVDDALSGDELDGNGEVSGQIHHSTAHAKIHVLDVKSLYRGRDLGGLLFSQAVSSLRKRYCNDDEEEEGGGGKTDNTDRTLPVKCNKCGGSHHKHLYDVHCTLDAEEDVTRHGKLVNFYEHLGCRVKPTKRVQYVNNNDSETYRKIPMQIDLHPPRVNTSPSKQERARARRRRFSHLIDHMDSFLPVQLVGIQGKLSVRSHDCQEVMKLDWLITETPQGIQFCSTKGHLLLASPNGNVTVFSPGDQDDDNISDLDIDTDVLIKWTHFVPCYVSDEDKSEAALDNNTPASDKSKCLWALRSAHGIYLTADSLRETFSCTRLPSFWQANGANISLVCTSDTPPRRHHYRKSWKFQTYDYVSSMRTRFLNFSLGRATLIEALGWIHSFPAHPFHAWSSDDITGGKDQPPDPSLRTLSFFMAETAREEGLPDWVQLIALIHELGEAVKILDLTHTGEMAKSIYDWTISSRSRVVGCKTPDRATFKEFRHLNTDEDDSRYNTEVGAYQANCGIENVFLMWTGCEYMFHLLRHNDVSLPEEALAMLRYCLLGDWHEHHEYSSITNADDEDMLPFIQEFDALRRRARLKCVDCEDFTDEECKFLWNSYYANIAAKYNCDHILSW